MTETCNMNVCFFLVTSIALVGTSQSNFGHLRGKVLSSYFGHLKLSTIDPMAVFFKARWSVPPALKLMLF